jgi:peptidoglycan/LPS O-acetylase OafA/YrhL
MTGESQEALSGTGTVATTTRRDLGRRIAFLDGVRGLAAMTVVLQHLLEQYSPKFLQWSLDYVNLGRVGVVAFFLVSGYVIPLSLGQQGLRTFVMRRFFRLYPVYWVATAVFVIVQFDTLRQAGQITTTSILVNITMLRGIVGVVCLLPPSWTLGIELFYYAQSSFASMRRLLDRAVLLGWVWLAIYLGAALVRWQLHIDLPTAPSLLLYTAAVGHALHLRDARGDRNWIPLSLAGLVVVPLGAFPAMSLSTPGDLPWSGLSYGLSALVGAALFAAIYLRRRVSIGRTLVWLGAISYSVYLFHPVVMFSLDGWLHGLPLILAAAAVIPLLGYVTYRLIELPSIQLGRRLTKRRKAVEAPPVAAIPAQITPAGPAPRPTIDAGSSQRGFE